MVKPEMRPDVHGLPRTYMSKELLPLPCFLVPANTRTLMKLLGQAYSYGPSVRNLPVYVVVGTCWSGCQKTPNSVCPNTVEVRVTHRCAYHWCLQVILEATWAGH